MPFWIIHFSDDTNKRPIHSGPFSLELEAQKFADENVKSGSYHIIQSRLRDWRRARGEVLQKLVEMTKDIDKGRMRVYTEKK